MLQTKKKFWLGWIVLLVCLIVAMILAISLGSVPVKVEDIISSFINPESTNSKILWSIRYPRVVTTLISGLNLGLSGLLIQAVLKNPLTDSNILGVNAGAALMAVIILVLFPDSSNALPLASFCGGILTFVLVMVLSWDKYGSTVRMILTGISIRAVISGIQDVIVTANSDKLQGAVMWLAGNLGGNSWQDVGMYLAYSLPAYILAYLLTSKMDLLQLDDSLVRSLGVSTRFYRLLIAAIGVYLSSITVAYAGMISFVGLIVPHIARILVGGRHRDLYLYSFVLGPLLLVLADTVSRTIVAPLEIPIGTTMSLIGGPFFIYLMFKNRKGRGS